MKYSKDFLSVVVNSYIESALWTTFDFDDDVSSDMLDRDSLKRAVFDCSDFLDSLPDNNIKPSQIGHDFWLTRNRHGVGFWDRGLGKLGEDLTDICQTMGEVHVYLSDTNEVVIE